ncbi:MAG: hypothetical protein ACR2FU_14800 [Streptosporangiaceae bacterium]
MSKASRNRDAARARVAQMRAEEARRARRRRILTGAGAVVLAIGAAVGIALAATSGGKAGASGGNGRPSPAAAGRTGTRSSTGPGIGNASTPVLSLGPIGSLGPLRPAPQPGPNGFEGVPIPAAAALAGRASAATGGSVDGIGCQTSEQQLFHIHAHLTIFVNGSQRQVPAGIGIPGSTAQDSAQGQVAVGGRCLYWLHTHAPDGIIHVESPVHRTYTLGDFFDEWGQPLGPARLGPVGGHVIAIYNGKLYRGNPRDIPLNPHAQIQLEAGRPLIAQQTITFPRAL